ncbi:MAG: hypothetical protein RLZZ230_451 [Candidatus Parcubacteria bacterium]|jgi:hypothetical protein
MKKYFMVLVISASLLLGFIPTQAHAAGEGSTIYNVAAGGVCFKFFKASLPGLYCGFGFEFASYVYTNRKGIMYLLAWSGGKMAKVTTPCMILNGVKYYCL